MDIGFNRAGVRTVFANEIDPDASVTYRSNPRYFNSEALRHGDIADYLPALEEFAGCDVVFGGPPCQGFSVAGKMDPQDKRSQLIWSFMDAVENVRPRLFVMENVKALGTLQKWASVRNQLQKQAHRLGYGYVMAVLRASDYGVPQARERFVFVGVHGADNDTVQERFLSGLRKMRRKAPTVREAFALLPSYGSEGNSLGSTAAIRVAKNPVIRFSPYRGSLLFNGRGRLVDLDSVSKTLPAQMGGNHTPIIDQKILEDPTAENWTEDYLARLRDGLVDPGKDSIEVPPSLRRMTVTEAAALQTFPNDFQFAGSYGSQYRQIGNAVPCDFAYAIANAAVSTLRDLGFSQIP